jgi:hypothetical protein
MSGMYVCTIGLPQTCKPQNSTSTKQNIIICLYCALKGTLSRSSHDCKYSPFVVVSIHQPVDPASWVMASLCVIHKEGLYPSSEDINRLMMMMMTYNTVSYVGPINSPFSTSDIGYNRLSINRPTKRGKEKSPSDGRCQCEKEMDDYLLACQQILEREPHSDTPCRASFLKINDSNDISFSGTPDCHHCCSIA